MDELTPYSRSMKQQWKASSSQVGSTRDSNAGKKSRHCYTAAFDREVLKCLGRHPRMEDELHVAFHGATSRDIDLRVQASGPDV